MDKGEHIHYQRTDIVLFFNKAQRAAEGTK